MANTGLNISEELEVGRALEKLFGLKPTGHIFNKYKDATKKALSLGTDRLKWKEAIQSLPYQGRYTLSDIEDISDRLKGKYQDAPSYISNYGGTDAYMKIMQYSPSTLDKDEIFHYWGKLPDNKIVQEALFDSDPLLDLKPIGL